MHSHKYFDLLLHDDGELASIVDSRIVERADLHEWPLSCVQKLTLEDGRNLIYKSQAMPTLEPEFYSAVRSDLLVGAQTIYRDPAHACLLLEWVDAVPLKDLRVDESTALSIGRELLEGISSMSGITGYHSDISDSGLWGSLVDKTLGTIRALVEDGKLHGTDMKTIASLSEWALDDSVMDLYNGKIGLVHGDFKGDNILVIPGVPGGIDRYKIIDWQRPLVGPTVVDLATLMESLGLDAARLVGGGAVRMVKFLLVGWYAECASWLPPACRILEGILSDTAGTESKG